MHGYDKWFIDYDSSLSEDATNALMSIFNGDADELMSSALNDWKNISKQISPGFGVMLISKSGAEGLNTKNVRQVHIMEPFWHANRIDQVIGRARRAHSHDSLPQDDRSVIIRTIRIH